MYVNPIISFYVCEARAPSRVHRGHTEPPDMEYRAVLVAPAPDLTRGVIWEAEVPRFRGARAGHGGLRIGRTAGKLEPSGG